MFYSFKIYYPLCISIKKNTKQNMILFKLRLDLFFDFPGSLNTIYQCFRMFFIKLH